MGRAQEILLRLSLFTLVILALVFLGGGPLAAQVFEGGEEDCWDCQEVFFFDSQGNYLGSTLECVRAYVFGGYKGCQQFEDDCTTIPFAHCDREDDPIYHAPEAMVALFGVLVPSQDTPLVTTEEGLVLTLCGGWMVGVAEGRDMGPIALLL